MFLNYEILETNKVLNFSKHSYYNFVYYIIITFPVSDEEFLHPTQNSKLKKK